MRHALPHTVPLDTNMLWTDDLEGSPASADGRRFTSYWSAVLAWDTSVYRTGTKSLRVTGPNTSNPHGVIVYGREFLYVSVADTAAVRFRATVWVKAPAGKVLVLGLRVLNPTDGATFNEPLITNFTGTGDWQQVTGTTWYSAVPGRVYRVGLQVRFNSAADAADTFWVDDVRLERTA